MEDRTDSELDGHDGDDIAVCGFSIKFPQDATTPEAFWKMMMDRRCAMTEFPPDRLNIDGFHSKKQKLNTLPLRGGHFIQDDLAAFDADFFSIAPTEASAMDPMQRWLLETAYRALENAGIPMESVSGTPTAVYTGSFSGDYSLQLSRDPENPPPYASVGFGLSMLANRISWFFNLQGPSIGLDSACSSTAMALDFACKSLRNGDCGMAMVAGSNLAGAPEPYIWMSNVNFLSPDSRCYSFDHRANGYARGEGIGVVVLKRVSDAIRDGNTIRAVIRSTGSNEDGRTPGITQPSRTAQEQLIRQTYRKAGLSLAHTRFFEAHGTGTQAGDPPGSAGHWNRVPSASGALKSNIGHLEGASGLAGLIKATLVLEKGIIPPNANYEKTNHKIDEEFLRIKFPAEGLPWPTAGLRRASVNSFGYGGSNCHLVLDDAYNYLRLRGLSGRHFSVARCPPLLPSPTNGLRLNGHLEASTNGLLSNGHHEASTNGLLSNGHHEASTNGLLSNGHHEASTNGLLSNGHHEASTNGSAKPPHSKALGVVYQSQSSIDALNQTLPGGGDALSNLAYTLAVHRSHLQWRSFALLQSPKDLHQLSEVISMPAKAHTDPPRIGFVFSGQGAQWYAMGRELLAYSSFSEELECATKYLETLGCSWSVTDELLKSEAASNIDNPEHSQTLCTILQVALVNLLRRFGVAPSATVGHSSGEIAAAYAAGHLSRESSWKVAYYRGLCSAEVASPGYPGPSGAMISIGLSEPSAREVVERLDQQSTTFGISVACINSPSNVTVSGEAGLIDQLKTEMDSRHVFARKLRVNTAYHSRQMKSISSKYISLMGSLTGPADKKPIVPMVSSVTGQVAHADELLDPAYWALNMISPVQFDQAVSTMCAKSPAEYVKKIDRSHHKIPIVNHLVEIGPHAALRGPLRDILRASSRGSSIAYTSILQRGQSAVDTTLSAMGELHCLGQALEFEAINQPSGEPKHKPSLLVNLPEYPFDHSQHYWHESRLSRAYRLRPDAPSELLGTRSRDWDPSDARWSHFIKTVEMPWTEHHVVNGETLYPGAGMVVMAIEAAKQLNRDANIDGFTLKGVRIEAAMDLSASKGICEVQTSLRQLSGLTYEFVVKTYVDDNWTVNCRGTITVALAPDSPEEDWDGSRKASEKQRIVTDLCDSIAACQQPVDHHNMYGFLKRTGYEFGPLFQGARNQRCNGALKQAAADVKLYSSSEEPHVVHPVSLDAIFHLCFTSFTAGGTRPMATSVPSGIGTLWVANTGLARPAQESVACLSKITKTTNRGFLASGGAMSSGPEKNLLVWMDGLELTNISAAPRPLEAPNPQQFCMNVEQKLALDKMDPHDLQAYLDATHPVEEDLTSFFQDMAHLIKMALERMLESVDYSQIDGQEAWKQRYWEWAQHHLTEGRLKDLPTTTAESFDQLCSRLGGITNVGPLYATVASNLSALMKGETDSLDLLMHSGLLKKYYEDLAGYRCTTQAVTYIDLLAHQKPGLTILEVGGGTGSTTRAVVGALAATGNTAGKTLRCNRYDFTDVSASFLEKARSEFAAYESQMTFGTLNIEQDFAEQGYEEGAYDIVVADAVLHITADLGQTFRNVRKALKPGGKLIMPELLHPDGWTAGFVFGLFPGWWLASREEGPLSPNLSAEGWGKVLRDNGFSGSDLVFTDFDGPAHHLGCIVSTAVLPPELRNGHLKPQKQGADIIIQTDCPQQRELAERLLPSLDAFFSPHESNIISLEEALDRHDQGGRSELSVVLVDYVASFVASLDAQKFAQLQKFVGISRRVLWISTGGGRAPTPDYALLNGLSRTLRTEFYELHLVTLALEETASGEPNKAAHVEQVVSEMLARRPGQYYEQHYVEIDGHLHTERLVEADYLKTDMDDQLRPYKVVPSAIGKAAFEISMKTLSGLEDAPYYQQSNGVSSAPGQGHIDISVKAVSLQAQGQLAVRGYEPEPLFGNYFSGVALNVGDRTGAIHPGDRVFAAHPGSFRSEVRTASQAAVRIPEHLPFSDACWLLPPLVVAYNLLVEVSRVRKGDSVLVHHGSRLLGQAAVGLLADQGVQDVWTTSSSEKEHAWILENLSIPEERVLPESWFDSGAMLVSHLRRKFDIVLWSHDHSKPPLSTDYVREGGRYILVDNGLSSSSATPLTMQPASANIAVYLHRSANHIPTQQALQYAAAYPHENLLRNSHNDVSKFCASDLVGFTRHLQHAHRDEITVVSLEDTAAVIDVRIPNHDSYSLDANATYVVAGGLGGLGSAMARWLVHRGARNLILLSRSGPRTAEARKMLEEFAVQGVRYETPACSIVDRDALRQTLSDCAMRLPPIKGCIQSSMVMTEKVFQNMDFADWQNTTDPKVAGSWNLHAELPRGLDFFVLISSMMGVLGSGSLAAYNAGNTYMDGLARFRLAQGERAVSLDLGAVPDGGYLVSNSEHAAGRQHVLQADKYALTPVRELCALLDVFCRPPAEEEGQEQTAAGLRCYGGQAIVGIRPPSHWKHAEEVPPTLNQPFWGHMHHVPLPAGLEGGGGGENGRKKRQTLNVVERLAAARSDNEAEEVVGEALAQRLSGLLGVAEDRLDPHKPMHSYGLDSLSAIELRSWIGQTFQVDFPVFVILGSATFTNSAKTIVSKMKSV
ncbi:hypothetical protein PG989_010639 [Apiospora arundinis]